MLSEACRALVAQTLDPYLRGQTQRFREWNRTWTPTEVILSVTSTYRVSSVQSYTLLKCDLHAVHSGVFSTMSVLAQCDMCGIIIINDTWLRVGNFYSLKEIIRGKRIKTIAHAIRKTIFFIRDAPGWIGFYGDMNTTGTF